MLFSTIYKTFLKIQDGLILQKLDIKELKASLRNAYHLPADIQLRTSSVEKQQLQPVWSNLNSDVIRDLTLKVCVVNNCLLLPLQTVAQYV